MFNKEIKFYWFAWFHSFFKTLDEYPLRIFISLKMYDETRIYSKFL